MTNAENDSLRLEDVYRPPAADEAPPGVSATRDFYVVSRTKFLVLFFATFGAYQSYWFFANWRRYRDRTRQVLYPFWRAVFSPLFAHKLFALIAGRPAAALPQVVAEAAPLPAASWNPSAMATLYVILVLASWVVDRLGDNVAIDLASTVLGLGTAYPLLVAQDAANTASGDPAGASNSRMTTINYVFIVIGLLIWLLFVFGITSMTSE
jgi:hypothetical protein